MTERTKRTRPSKNFVKFGLEGCTRSDRTILGQNDKFTVAFYNRFDRTYYFENGDEIVYFPTNKEFYEELGVPKDILDDPIRFRNLDLSKYILEIINKEMEPSDFHVKWYYPEIEDPEIEVPEIEVLLKERDQHKDLYKTNNGGKKCKRTKRRLKKDRSKSKKKTHF